MTDIWDELCKEFDDALSMQEYVVPKSLMDRWNQTKAEGDRLKDKADKWDLLDKIGGPPKGDARIQWHIDMCDLRIKLEAVKTHLTEYPDVDGGICDDCPYPKECKIRDGACGNCAVGKVKFWLQDHKKILEGETLQSIGETQA